MVKCVLRVLKYQKWKYERLCVSYCMHTSWKVLMVNALWMKDKISLYEIRHGNGLSCKNWISPRYMAALVLRKKNNWGVLRRESHGRASVNELETLPVSSGSQHKQTYADLCGDIWKIYYVPVVAIWSYDHIGNEVEISSSILCLSSPASYLQYWTCTCIYIFDYLVQVFCGKTVHHVSREDFQRKIEKSTTIDSTGQRFCTQCKPQVVAKC